MSLTHEFNARPHPGPLPQERGSHSPHLRKPTPSSVARVSSEEGVTHARRSTFQPPPGGSPSPPGEGELLAALVETDPPVHSRPRC